MTESLNPNKVGVSVGCATCGRTKNPAGRSAPMEMASSMCHHSECPGYWQAPEPGHLWPGESEADFGYRVPDAGTRIKGES